MQIELWTIVAAVLAYLVLKPMVEEGAKYFFKRSVTTDYRTTADCDKLRDVCKTDRTNGHDCINGDLQAIKRALISVITYNENIPSDEKVELQQELFR